MTAPVYNLDPAAIGEILINALAGASAIGHKRIAGTLRDYCDWESPDVPGEARFVRDAITGAVPEAVVRWFGDANAAHEHALNVALGE
jgi:hypothetical protein